MNFCFVKAIEMNAQENGDTEEKKIENQVESAGTSAVEPKETKNEDEKVKEKDIFGNNSTLSIVCSLKMFSHVIYIVHLIPLIHTCLQPN